MPKLHIKQAMTTEIAMEWMRVYDECDKNKSLAARELGVDRRTLGKYIDEYWGVYAKTKIVVRKDSEPIDFSKVREFMGQNAMIRNKLIRTITPAIDQLIERMNDPAIVTQMSIKELVSVVKELTPYVMPKMSADDSNSDSNLPTKRENVLQFINNIYNFKKQEAEAEAEAEEGEAIQIN